MINTPRAETITGSDLSGTDGAANRTYTLANDDAILAQMQIIRASAILQSGVDFSFDTSTNTITFISRVWDNQPISLDYFTADTSVDLNFNAKAYSITGADLSGSSGATKRVFQFLRSGALGAQMAIIKSSATLQNGVDFTFSPTTRTVIFNVTVADDEIITLDFFIQSGSYATTLQISEFSGTGVSNTLEELGTGDNSNASFDLKHGNVLDDSFTLYYGADGVNKLTIMVEGTHYLINLEDGRIFLLAAGVTALSTKELFMTYTHSPKQSDNVLNKYLLPAVVEAEKLTQNYWGAAKTTTQYKDGYDSGYPQTDKPFGFQIDSAPEFELKNRGINSITSVKFLSRTREVDMTVESDLIDFDEDGRLILNSQSIPNGKRNIEIIYIHGYTTVPNQVQELVSLISGVMALVNISGGSYKDISVYTIGRKSFSLGQIYVNIGDSIKQLGIRIDKIVSDLGERWACA